MQITFLFLLYLRSLPLCPDSKPGHYGNCLKSLVLVIVARSGIDYLLFCYRLRSLCCLVCKWAYQADAEGDRHWDDSFWQQIGLEDLIKDNYAKIGEHDLTLTLPWEKWKR